jgi:hypothetical protein
MRGRKSKTNKIGACADVAELMRGRDRYLNIAAESVKARLLILNDAFGFHSDMGL